MAEDGINSFMTGPDEQGRFGIFGGRFVSETLMPLILELEERYEFAKTDPTFWAEMHDLWTHYVGRPSPLYHAERLTAHLGGAPMGIRAVIAYFLVDQSFALSLADFERRQDQSLQEKVAFFFGTVAPITAIWNVSTAVGAQMGRNVPESWGLDFAMPITFVGMTAAMLRTVPHGVAMAVSVGVTLMLWAMPYGTGLLVGAAVGMAAGAITEAWRERA